MKRRKSTVGVREQCYNKTYNIGESDGILSRTNSRNKFLRGCYLRDTSPRADSNNIHVASNIPPGS